MRKRVNPVGPALVLVLVFLVGRAECGVIVGSNYTISGTNAVTDFSDTVAFDETSKSIDSGNLTVTETITQVNPTSQWVDFYVQTASGGPLASDPTADWSFAIFGVQLSAPATDQYPFIYFAANGVPFSNLTAASGFGVATNPMNPSLGEVLTFNGYTPGAPDTSFGINVFSYPFNFLNTVGVDTATANGFHFDALIVDAVPEPSSLFLGGSAIMMGLVCWRRRRRRDPGAARTKIATITSCRRTG